MEPISETEAMLTEYAAQVIENPKTVETATEITAALEAKGVTLYDMIVGQIVGTFLAVKVGGVEQNIVKNIAILQGRASRQSAEIRAGSTALKVE